MVKTEQKEIQPETLSKQIQSTSTSSLCKKKFKGVRMRSWGSWVSEIRAPNQKTRIWLGSYSTAEAAARAYDAALLCLKGSSANLNFPISSYSHYNIPDDHTVMSPKSIQRVAAAAAATATAADGTSVDSATTNPQILSPPLPSSSSSTIPTTSSSSVSSPAMSSSPSDQLDDDVSLIQSFESYSDQPPISVMEHGWYNFDGIQSPKYVDHHQMFINGVSSFDHLPSLMDDYFFEEGDIHLWSFC